MTRRDHRQSAGGNADFERFITDKLARRPPRRNSVEAELAALRQMARHMAASPHDLLPSFVRLAMDVTGSVASGLALIDDDHLVWKHLHGTMTQFENLRSPRTERLASIAKSEGPILLAHPERIFAWIAEAGLVFPEALIIPLRVADEYAGALWVGAGGNNHFDRGDARVLSELSEFVGIALQVIQELAKLRKSLEHQEIVASEMGHRLKNVFAIADGMVRATAKNAATPEAMVDALTGRLHALERSHALLRHSVDRQQSEPFQTDLRSLLSEIVRAHCHGARDMDWPFALSGPQVACGEHATNGIALIINELATNASKYGSLSAPAGRLEISWVREADHVVLRWIESGAPSVMTRPSSKGFGTTLIERTVTAQFRGEVEWGWRADGLHVRIVLNAQRLAT